MASLSRLLGAAAAMLLTSASAAPTIGSESYAGPGQLHKRLFKQGECTTEQWQRFAVEYSFGIEYTSYITNFVDIANSFMFEQLIPLDYQTDEFRTLYADKYLRVFSGLSNDGGIEVTINCGNQDLRCLETVGNGRSSYAFTDGHTIHLCDPFFEGFMDSSSVKEEERCAEKDRTLGEFETGAWTLFHEFGHLDHGGTGMKYDNRYCNEGQDCADLAETDPTAAIQNADTWMFAAMGLFWADRCKRDIPLSPPDNSDPDEPETPSEEPERCPDPYPEILNPDCGSWPAPYNDSCDFAAYSTYWVENNVCTDICPGGAYDFCAIVDESDPDPTTGYCQCTATKCTDEGNYSCYQPA